MLRSSLLACVLLVSTAALASAAVTELTAIPNSFTTSNSPSQPWVGFSTFTGATVRFQYGMPFAVQSGSEWKLKISCPGLEVKPSMRCLTDTDRFFDITVLDTAAATIATPCTFSLAGTADVTDFVGITDLNNMMKNAWTVGKTTTLVHDEQLKDNSITNPTVVVPGTYEFNFTRSGGNLENIDRCDAGVLCSNEGQSSTDFFGTNVAGQWSIDFPPWWINDEDHLPSNTYVYCTFNVETSCSDPKDEYRYHLEPLYFKVVPKNTRTQLRLIVPSYTTSTTANTSVVLTVSPTPELYSWETLTVSIDHCDDTTQGQGRRVTRGYGAPGAADSSSKTFGVGATSNAGLAVILPPLTAGALFATCEYALTGSASALNRYMLATYTKDDGSVDNEFLSIKLGKQVILTPTFDPESTPSSNAHPRLGVNSIVRFVPDQTILVGDLSVEVECNVCTDSSNTINMVSPSDTVSFDSTYANSWTPIRADNSTESPQWTFVALSFKDDDNQITGQTTCTYKLTGEDAEYYSLSSSSQVFTVTRGEVLSVTVNNGLNSPVTVSELRSTYLSKLTLQEQQPSYNREHRVAVADKDKTVLTIEAPTGYELGVGINCTNALASVSGGDGQFVAYLGFGMTEYQTIYFSPDATASGKIAITNVVYDSSLASPGTVVSCLFQLLGRDAASFNTIPPFTFFVGNPEPLMALTLPSLSVDGVIRGSATVNVTRGDDATADATAHGSVYFYPVCTTDWYDAEDEKYVNAVAFSVSNPFTPLSDSADGSNFLSFAAGKIDYSSQFKVYPPSTTTTVTATCTFFFVEAGDALRFTVPEPLKIQFKPRVLVTLSGAVFSTETDEAKLDIGNVYARVASASSQTVTVVVAELPSAGEDLIVELYCDDTTAMTTATPAPVLPATNPQLTFSSSSAKSQTFTFTAPTLPSGTNKLVWCSFSFFANPFTKYYGSVSIATFAVGDVGSIAVSATEVDVYVDNWASVTLTPSSCLEGGTLVYECTRPAQDLTINPDGREYVTDSYYSLDTSTLGGSFGLSLYAPTDVKTDYDILCFPTHFSTIGRAYETPANVTFHIKQKATFVINGLGDRSWPVADEVMTLSVYPTEAPKKDGVGAFLKCQGEADSGSSVSEQSYYLYWFAGSTETISVRVPIGDVAWTTPGYSCWVETDTKDVDGDDDHYVSDTEPTIYRFVSAVSFSVSSPRFLYADCAGSEDITVTVAPNGAIPLNFGLPNFIHGEVVLKYTCRTDAGVILGPNYLTFTSHTCSEVPAAQTFTLHNSNQYKGYVTCSFENTGSNSQVSAVAPASHSFYTGLEDPTEDDSGLSTGAIIGIVIGSVVGAGIIAGVAYVALSGSKGASVAPSAGSSGANGANGATAKGAVEMQPQQVQVSAQLPEA